MELLLAKIVEKTQYIRFNDGNKLFQHQQVAYCRYLKWEEKLCPESRQV